MGRYWPDPFDLAVRRTFGRDSRLTFSSLPKMPTSRDTLRSSSASGARSGQGRYSLVRRLDARTDAEREAHIPADDIEALDRELVALLERRQAALSAIHAARQGADQSTRNVIDEITP